MKWLTNLIGGLAGAVALNVVHETVRRLDPDAPNIQLVGEEGLNKLMDRAGGDRLEGNALYIATLSGDILSNALYYSLIGSGKPKYLLFRGLCAGAAAGLGALELTKPIGLDDTPITHSDRTKAMTVGYYAFGGLVTALTIRAIRKGKPSGNM